MNMNAGLKPGAIPGLWRKAVAFIVVLAMLAQQSAAIAQGIVADQGAGPRPGVTTAPNGVPLINIVTPNGSGLSHNLYQDFNVDNKGVILNNSNNEVGTSTLGGATPGNANLRYSGQARVILNEVTSTNPSALNGVIEVYGQSADVIVANPNGLSCNGCGFLNTPHATLTTGRPQIDGNGNLTGFKVEGGDISFGGAGANLASAPGAVDLFDVVARAIHVNAPIYAKHLRLTAGRNTFSYADGTATPLAAVAGAPTNAIDGSDVGALTAGRIRIISTEKGSGVNMPAGMAANAGELSITADGKIAVGRVHGETGVAIKSTRQVVATRITSKQEVKVEAAQGITLKSISAAGNIVLNAGDGLLSASEQIESAARITLSSNKDVSVAGLTAGSDITVHSTGSTTASGMILSGGAILISANGLNLGSTISGVDFAASQAQGRLVLTGAPTATLSLDAGSGALTTGNLVSSGAMSLHATGAINYLSLLSLSSASIISDSGGVSISNPTAAQGDLTIQTLSAAMDLSGTNAKITSNGKVTLAAQSITMAGADLSFAGLSVTSLSSLDLTGAHVATTSGDLTLNANSISTDSATQVLAARDLIMTVALAMSNAGMLAAARNLTLNTSGSFTNQSTGLLYAGQDMALNVADTLSNQQGAIQAAHDLAIGGLTPGSAAKLVLNHAGLIQAGHDLSITATTLTNEATGAPIVNRKVLIEDTTKKSGFTVNPDVLDKPVGVLTENGNYWWPGWIYPNQNTGSTAEYSPQMWSKTTMLDDGVSYVANTYYRVNFYHDYDVRGWILGSPYLQKDANGNPTTTGLTEMPYYSTVTHRTYWVCNSQGMLGCSDAVPQYHDTISVYAFDNNSRITERLYQDQIVQGSSTPGVIKAGNNLIIKAGTLNNTYSSIEAGGDANLSGTTLNNQGLVLATTVERTCISQGTCYAYDANGNRVAAKDINQNSSITYVKETTSAGGGTILAKGNMVVTYGTVNNTGGSDAIAGSATPTALKSQNVNFASTPGDGFGGIPGGDALFKSNPGATAGQPGTSTSGGMGGTIPGQTFLYETRAPFLDIGKFYGSSYYLKLIGYSPETQVTFLGDAYYENKLIDSQLRQQTGAGLGSFLPGEDAIEEMKLLLDNGADYLKTHHMTLGEKLDPKLIAGLTKSIVVYETRKVNGIDVLVPVVYLAEVDRQRLKGGGGLIQGGNLEVNADHLNNGGTLAATHDLKANLGDGTVVGGSFAAGGDIKLDVTGNLDFKAASVPFGNDQILAPQNGIKAGGEVVANVGGEFKGQGTGFSSGGDFTVNADSIDLGVAEAPDGSVTQPKLYSSIDSGGGLELNAKKDITFTAADIKSAGDMKFAANNIISTTDQVDRTFTSPDGKTVTKSSVSQGSHFNASGDIGMKANNDVVLTDTGAKAAGDIGVDAGHNIIVGAGNSTSHTDSHDSGANWSSSGTADSSTVEGSKLAAGGNMAMHAGNDVVVQASEAGAKGDLSVEAGRDVVVVQGQNTASSSESSHSSGDWGSRHDDASQSSSSTTVGSKLSGGGDVNIKSGRDTTVSASKVEAGAGGGTGDLTVDAGHDLRVISGKDTYEGSTQSSGSGILHQEQSTSHDSLERNAGSDLTGTGNVKLTANNKIGIGGSNVEAGGELDVKAREVLVTGAGTNSSHDSQSSAEGLFKGSSDGFISLYGGGHESQSSHQTVNNASTLKGGTNVNVTSIDDLTIVGSDITGGQDVNLASKSGDVTVLPGEQTADSSQSSGTWGFGITYNKTPSSVSVGIGAGSKEQSSEQGGRNNAVSHITAGRDTNITAGHDATLTATEVTAGRDANVTAENNVLFDVAQDTSHSHYKQSQSFVGLTLEVSSGLLSAEQDAESAVGQAGTAKNLKQAGRALVAGMAAASTLDNIVNKDGNLVEGSLKFGFTKTESEGSDSSSTAVTTKFNVGRKVDIEATSGDLTMKGTQVNSGLIDPEHGDISLTAGKKLTLESANNETSSDSQNSQVSGGVGVTVGLNKKGGGAPSLTADFSYSDGNSSTHSSEQSNTHINGTNQVTLKSGTDTELKGAVVKGKGVDAEVGGDLKVTSPVDTAEAHSERKSLGVSGSVGVDGKVSVGVNGSYGKGDGSYTGVGEQSGIFAGENGVQVDVKNKTTLEGGAIASTADKSKNTIKTGTIETKDIGLGSNYNVSSYAGGIGGDGKLGIPGYENDNGSSSGTLKSTVAPGEITITDPSKQSQDVAAINREAPTAVPNIDKLPELGKVLDAQGTSIAQYQKAAAFVAGQVGDISGRLEKEAAARGDKETADLWAEGGAYRAMLHAISGAVLGSVNGLSGVIEGGAGGAISTFILPKIVKAVDDELRKQGKDPNDPANAYLRNLLITTFTTAFTGAATGGGGAGYGAANSANNYLTHEQLDKVKEISSKLQKCNAEKNCSAKEIKLYTDLLKGYQTISQYQSARLAQACASGDVLNCAAGLKDLKEFMQAVHEAEKFGHYNPNSTIPGEKASSYLVDLDEMMNKTYANFLEHPTAENLAEVNANRSAELQKRVNTMLAAGVLVTAICAAAEPCGTILIATLEAAGTTVSECLASLVCINELATSIAEGESGLTPGTLTAGAALTGGAAQTRKLLLEKKLAEIASQESEIAAVRLAESGGIPKAPKYVKFDYSNLQSKLRDYLLDPAHPQNQTKASWFQQALGFNKTNWQDLASQLKFDPITAIPTEITPYGQKFEQSIPITGANGKTINTNFVFIQDLNGVVRFVTGIPAKK